MVVRILAILILVLIHPITVLPYANFTRGEKVWASNHTSLNQRETDFQKTNSTYQDPRVHNIRGSSNCTDVSLERYGGSGRGKRSVSVSTHDPAVGGSTRSWWWSGGRVKRSVSVPGCVSVVGGSRRESWWWSVGGRERPSSGGRSLVKKSSVGLSGRQLSTGRGSFPPGDTWGGLEEVMVSLLERDLSRCSLVLIAPHSILFAFTEFFPSLARLPYHNTIQVLQIAKYLCSFTLTHSSTT